MKLCLDHHFSPAIASELRRHGHDVCVVQERGWQTIDDESLLIRCSDERRALMTNNAGDFSRILQEWAVQARVHFGVIFTSDSSLPRDEGTIGLYISRLRALLAEHPGEDDLANVVLWL